MPSSRFDPSRAYADETVLEAWAKGDDVIRRAITAQCHRCGHVAAQHRPGCLHVEAAYHDVRCSCPGFFGAPQHRDPPISPPLPPAPADTKYEMDDETWVVTKPVTDEAPPPLPKAPLEHLGDIGRALTALAYQLEHGANRPGRKRGDWAEAYAEHKRMELLGKAARHLLARMGGQILDEHGRPHAVAAAADLMLFVELEARP